jgi:hypothetical protein
MKKSGKVTLGFVAGVAMVLLGCQRTEMQRCVDQYGMVTEDFYCNPARPSTYRNFYHWHYGGSGGFHYGTYVHGGSSVATPGVGPITATPGVGHSSASGVSRGGFGAHGSAHSAGS